jgi:hypothetical protein
MTAHPDEHRKSKEDSRRITETERGERLRMRQPSHVEPAKANRYRETAFAASAKFVRNCGPFTGARISILSRGGGSGRGCKHMRSNDKGGAIAALMAMALLGWVSGPAAAAVHIEGQVQAGGGAVAGSTVTLWTASTDAPARLAQTQTDADGQFIVSVDQTPSGEPSFYLVASGGTPAVNKAGGDNKAISLLAVLGGISPAKVVVNEFTTIASVWTHNQFIDGTAIKGSPLALRIAAANVPNFVDLSTGSYGTTILDALNGGQTPTLANFGTLANVLAGCTTRVKADACASLFAAATPPAGACPPTR